MTTQELELKIKQIAKPLEDNDLPKTVIEFDSRAKNGDFEHAVKAGVMLGIHFACEYFKDKNKKAAEDLKHEMITL